MTPIDSIYLLKLMLSFFSGGFFVLLTVAIAERYGPSIGGIFAGLPSTTAAGLFFIGFVQGTGDASVASTIIPAAVSGSLVFVLVYVTACARLGYLAGVFLASIAWFTVALPLAILGLSDILIATMLFLIVWTASVSILRREKSGSFKRVNVNRNLRYLLARVIFAGSVVSCAVLASSYAGPLWGGALAAFPAMFFTTFVILGKEYGTGYSKAFARSTPLGLFSVVPYAWGVHYLYPSTGLIAGTVFSYMIALITATIIYYSAMSSSMSTE